MTKCNRCKNIEYGICTCGWSNLPSTYKGEEKVTLEEYSKGLQ